LALYIIDVNNNLHETFALVGPIVKGQAWPLKMGPKTCPETSGNNYQLKLRSFPEQRRSQLYGGRSLKSRKHLHCSTNFCKISHYQISTLR